MDEGKAVGLPTSRTPYQWPEVPSRLLDAGHLVLEHSHCLSDEFRMLCDIFLVDGRAQILGYVCRVFGCGADLLGLLQCSSLWWTVDRVTLDARV